MDAKLQAKCDLIAHNIDICWRSAKLDWLEACALGALIYTTQNHQANEEDIRACRELRNEKSRFCNLHGHVDLALLCKMAMAENSEEFLEKVQDAYACVRKGHVFHSEYEALAAMCIADFAQPDEYDAIAQKTADILEKMEDLHPMLTGQEDTTIAALLAMSGLDVDETLAESERVFQDLKSDHFTFAKNELQSVAMVLALNNEPTQIKDDRFHNLREALKESGSRMYASDLPIVAALVNTGLPIDQIVSEVHEADTYLKEKNGFTNVIGVGPVLRRVIASALVLQVHEEDMNKISVASSSITTNALTSVLVQQIIQAIILTIIIVSICASNNSHN